MNREEFLQQMVLTLAAKSDRSFIAGTAVDTAIHAYDLIKKNVLKNSQEFTSAGGKGKDK